MLTDLRGARDVELASQIQHVLSAFIPFLQTTLDFLAAENSAVGRHLLLQSTVGLSTHLQKKFSTVCISGVRVLP